MKLLLTILVVLFMAKVYTTSLYRDKVKENSLAASFIEYDLSRKNLESLEIYQKQVLLDLAKSRLHWYNATQLLLQKLESRNAIEAEEIASVFNNASLKELLEYPTVEYVANKGLSENHNRLLAMSSGYNVVIKELLVNQDSVSKVRPYILGLKRSNDSMDLVLGAANYGKIEAKVVYKEDTIEVNELPINLGPIKGDVIFFVTDSLTKEKRWCNRRY